MYWQTKATGLIVFSMIVSGLRSVVGRVAGRAFSKVCRENYRSTCAVAFSYEHAFTECPVREAPI
jgi:hypothetical protein